MKKFLLATLVSALVGLNVYAAKDDKKTDDKTASVTYKTATQFETDFKDATDVIWKTGSRCQQADFTVDGQRMSAFYSFDGQFMGLTHNVTAKAIPAKAMEKIEKQYEGYTVGRVIVLQTNTALNPDLDPVAYFVDLKNDSKEVLVRITPQLNIEFFQQIQ
ncbi:hypothetical protein GCM10027037_02290 [Mucilaginibacter koreensis]